MESQDKNKTDLLFDVTQSPFYPSAEQIAAAQKRESEGPLLTPAQAAYLGSVFAPGAGIADAAGKFPEFPGRDVPLEQAFAGEPMPSIKENIQAGGIDRYLFAPLQGLGVLGDAAYGIPFAGPVIAGGLKAPAALATLAGGIAKASKGSKAVDKGLGSLNDKNTINLVHGTTADVAKQIEEIGEIQPKLGSYVEDMYITRGDYADIPPSDYPPLASFFSTADDPSSAIGAMKAQIGYKLGKELNDPISLGEIKKHGAVVLSDANPRTIFKMDENYRPYNLMDEPASIDEPLGFESEDIVSLIPQKPKKILTGDDLVKYVKKNDPEFAGIRSLDQPKN